jgi:Peptidase inhibitor family I36/Domain of unknown function (DUF4214)
MPYPRIISLASGVVFVFATAVSAQLSLQDLEPRDGACFYENFNYDGNSFCVRAGEALEALPRGMNDRVSSIRTFGRSAVTVYRDDSFSGGSVRFDDDVPDLRLANWNDRISSVQVRGTSYGYRGGLNDRSSRSASRIVRRAYQDVLGRAPDAEGLQYYRGRVIDEGWSEAQVRADLRRSEEYKTRASDDTGLAGTSRASAQSIVRRAYLSVLKREPDPASEGYIERVLRDGWSQADVERDLRRSAEYRNRIQ